MSLNNVYYDEEECLGLGIFVAELELILGTSKDRKPDQVQLLELLQKLQASLATADAAVVKQHQKRCEAALIDVIYKGACSAVRHQTVLRPQQQATNRQQLSPLGFLSVQVRVLINNCLVKMYTGGDLLPLYSRVSSLQSFLQDKNAAAEVRQEAVAGSGSQQATRHSQSSQGQQQGGLNMSAAQLHTAAQLAAGTTQQCNWLRYSTAAAPPCGWAPIHCADCKIINSNDRCQGQQERPAR
jgi:hypothetical protein